VIRFPPAVLGLLLANLAGFALQLFAGDERSLSFALWPIAGADEGASNFGLWQLVTYSFLHADGWHLLFNMIGLVTFGSALEHTKGSRRLLILYFASVVAAAITQLVVPPLFDSPPNPTIGASGGVFGLLFAYAVYFPRNRVLLLFPPIPMPAWVFATLYTVVELYLGVTGTQAGVAHFAHLGGMIGAAIVLWSWRRA
jgi:membrane associated rhomboid family serine protease